MDAALALPPPLSVPPLARRWVYAGLVPFVLSALLIWLVWPDARPYVTQALCAYAAVVVALLGGVHWGLAMRHSDAPARLLASGAAFALLAWAGVMMRPDAGLVVQGVLLVAGYLVDRKLYPAEGLAAWLTLRFRFSAVAAFSCFIGAANA
ncbi:DUF3429 domain-containing protein [Ideonella sp. BN130291]|uniref:DUF3429 domain-containing protein n=1 Tax=Ideonella sp. BN130291 TaxID=3112940 RepID=UPI002E26091C|nr:DUF3429 domain-containing protein [Ideonella sp. BN130291]